MALVGAVVQIDASPARIWQALLDWEGSSAWMVDATSVAVVGDRREGIGTRIRAVTRVLGVPVVDLMEVRRWEPERLIEVVHLGRVVRGVGWFEIKPSGSGTRFEWAEEIDPPLGPLGEAGAVLLRRPLGAMLRKSLEKLKRMVESS